MADPKLNSLLQPSANGNALFPSRLASALDWTRNLPMVPEQRGGLVPGRIPAHVAGTHPGTTARNDDGSFAWGPAEAFNRLLQAGADERAGHAAPAPSDAYVSQPSQSRALGIIPLGDTATPWHTQDRQSAADAFDVGGLAAMGGFAAPKPANSVGIFGGRLGARTLAEAGDRLPLEAIELAERMRAGGFGREEIYRATSRILDGSPYAGVHYGADGLPRFEIDDSAMRVRPSAEWAAAPQHFPHPTLEPAYPDLHSLDTMVSVRPGAPTRASMFSDGMMTMQAPDTTAARGPALHELQHWVQDHESFAGGTNPDAVRALPEFSQAIHAFADEAARRGVRLDTGQQAAAYDRIGRELYRRAPGEVEARAVDARRDLTPEQRRTTPPWQSRDVPEPIGPEWWRR